MARKDSKMPFDFSAVRAQAEKVAEGADNQGNGQQSRDFAYPLVYPGQKGKISVKLLFNPKSNSVARLVYNHKVNQVNVPCMRTWGQSCPICDAVNEIKNLTNDNHRLNASTRAISLAQYIASDYPVTHNDEAKTPVQPGEVILFMYPWSVYKDIQQILGQAKTEQDLAQLIGSNTGMIFDVNHGDDNRYSANINPFDRHSSCATEEEFDALLNGLPSLNDLYRPSQPTEKQLNQVNETARSLRQQYLAANMQQPGFINPNPGQQSVYSPTPSPAPVPQVDLPPVPTFPVPNAVASPATGFSGDEDIPFNSGSPNQAASVAPTAPAATMKSTVPTATAIPVTSAPHTTAPQMGFQVPQTPTAQSSTDTMATASVKPECFGTYGTPPASQCALCGMAIPCIESSGK